MTWDKCVLDATMGVRDGLFTFCPAEFDEDGSISAVVTGMNFIGAQPPDHMAFVGVVHEDGQEAADRFCEEHAEALAALRNPLPGPTP